MSVEQDKLMETVNGMLTSINSASPEVIQQTLEYGQFVHQFEVSAGIVITIFSILGGIAAYLRRDEDDGIMVMLIVFSILGLLLGPLMTAGGYLQLVKISQSPMLYVIQQLN